MMTKRKIVVALGGNAILSNNASAQAQQQALEETAEYLVKFIENGDDLVISHGNGPQVGNLLLQQIAGATPNNPAMPLDTCVAMTQGSIGYWMQNALGRALEKRNIDKQVVSLITQVIVDEADPAFEQPSKPIGPFLSKEEAEAEMKRSQAVFKEDSGRGWRKVVPSPKPISIKEHIVINQLVENGVIPITVGGGGIPVVKRDNELRGVEAVIDKDFASQKLAELIQADLLVVLTGVDNIYINFNQPNQKQLNEVTITEMKGYIAEHQFAAGSMLPKVEAAIAFVENSKNGKAIVTSLENIEYVLTEGAGTIITK
ncbi:carbamate kinase [Carnobacterium sp. 17-4]|nr:carbamate kinase [Carnobacterium sp. 17-4]